MSHSDETPIAIEAASTKKAAPESDEPKYPTERWLDLYADLGRELNRPVTRGSVAGALHRLELERKSHMPKTLTRSDMLAALVDYLDAPEGV